MDLYIPYGYTPYEHKTSYGIFSTRQAAEEVLEPEKRQGIFEEYGVEVKYLDEKDPF